MNKPRLCLGLLLILFFLSYLPALSIQRFDSAYYAAFTVRSKSFYEAAQRAHSIEMAQEVLRYAKKFRVDSTMGMCYFSLAKLYERELKHYRAINNYFLSMPYFRKAGDTKHLTAALNNIASIYAKGGYLDRAMSFYKDAEALLEQTRYTKEKLIIRFQIAKAYRLTGKYATAKKMYDSLLTLFRALNHEVGMNKCYTDLGYIAIQENRTNMAYRYYELSAEVFTRESKEKQRATLKKLNSIAYIDTQLGRYEFAEKKLKKALALSGDVDKAYNKDALADIYSTYADFYLKQNRKDSAVLMYEKFIHIGNPKDFDKEYLEIAQQLYKHYRNDDPIKADTYNDIVYTFGKEQNELQAALRKSYLRYEIQAADSKHELQSAHEKRMIQMKVNFGIYIATLILVTCGVWYYFYERRKRRGRRQQVIQKLKINPLTAN